MDDLTKAMEAALRGIDYPATRAKLLLQAVENHASPAVIARLQALPETADFLNEQQLQDELGVNVPGVHSHGWE